MITKSNSRATPERLIKIYTITLWLSYRNMLKISTCIRKIAFWLTGSIKFNVQLKETAV